MDENITQTPVDPQRIPGLIDRIKALVTDNVVIIFLLLIASNVFSDLEHVPDAVKIAALILIFGLYDPLCTAFLGGSLGHLAMGLRVRSKNDYSKNISIFKAIPRYLLKFFLGAFSLFTVTGNKNKMAIHDMAVDSIVLFKSKN